MKKRIYKIAHRDNIYWTYIGATKYKSLTKLLSQKWDKRKRAGYGTAKLYIAFNESNRSDWTIEPLTEFIENWEMEESEHIIEYDTFNSGLNSTPDGKQNPYGANKASSIANSTSVVCENSGIIYNSVREAARELKIARWAIVQNARGLTKRTKSGLTFRFAETD